MKKKYVLGILTAVVLMFGITACEKTEEPAPEQSATQEEQKEDQDNDTSDQDVNQDGQNEQDQTQQEQTENTQDVNNLGAGTITVYAQNKDVSGFDKKEVSLEDAAYYLAGCIEKIFVRNPLREEWEYEEKICIGNFDSGCADVWNYSL